MAFKLQCTIAVHSVLCLMQSCAALFDRPFVSLIWLLAVQRDAPPASVRGEPVEPGNAPSDVTSQA